MIPWNEYFGTISKADKFELHRSNESLYLKRDIGLVRMTLEFPEIPTDIIKPDARIWANWQDTPSGNIRALEELEHCHRQLPGYRGKYSVEEELSEYIYEIEIATTAELKKAISTFNKASLDGLCRGKK